MKPMQNRQRDDVALPRLRWRSQGERVGNPLVSPLMGPAMIKEGDILVDHSPSMPVTEDQDMVQAFAPDRTEETLTQRIGLRRLKRGVEQFRVDAADGAFEQHAIFVVIVADQEARTDAGGCRLPDRLG